MNPLLSIVVPTKDRYKYLTHLIDLIDSFKSDQIELVLQDNTFDNREIINFLSKKEFSYIKYFHEKDQISVSLNADMGILNSSGEYVCFIGDDDGVLPNILQCVRWMKDNEIDVVVPAEVRYIWPDYINDKNGHRKSDLLYLNEGGFYSNAAKVVDPLEALNALLKEGCLNRGNLPLVYHGIASRSILDKIYAKGKTFFPGSSPDIANGIALSFYAKKYVRLDFPIIISGQSKMHGGGIRKYRDRIANINDVPFLPSDARANWEKNIPKVWTGETVWPESAAKALRYMDRLDLVEKINFNRILTSFILNHPRYFKLALKEVRNPVTFSFRFCIDLAEKIYFALYRRIRLYFFNIPFSSKKKVYGLNNINNVSVFLNSQYSEFKPHFRP